MRLLEALPGLRRVDRERVVLGAAADDHARDQAPAADHVDHGELLGDPRRRVVERQGIADDGDPDAARLAGQDRRDQVRRRHVAVGVLVMLVHADAVKTEVLRRDQLVEVPVVQPVADGGVVQLVGARDPRRSVVRGRQLAVRHQVEGEEPHRCTSMSRAQSLEVGGTLVSRVHHG
jgi:hypothetical protein